MSVIDLIEQDFKKKHVVDVKSGDTVRVHQKIREGKKERIQYFEGLVIRVDRKNSHTASITVRRIASGVGVEKTYLLHSPLVTKVEVKKRSKVRRNYLSYMRERTGKAARLTAVDFDRETVNDVPDVEEKSEKAKPAEGSVAAESEVSKSEPKTKPKPETSESEDTKASKKNLSEGEKKEKSAESNTPESKKSGTANDSKPDTNDKKHKESDDSSKSSKKPN